MVDSVYNQMTEEQRIGQLFMPIVAGDISEANKNRIQSLVRNQHIGGGFCSQKELRQISRC